MKKEPKELVLFGYGLLTLLLYIFPYMYAYTSSFSAGTQSDYVTIVNVSSWLVIGIGIVQSAIALYGYWDKFNIGKFIGYFVLSVVFPPVSFWFFMMYIGRGIWKFESRKKLPADK